MNLPYKTTAQELYNEDKNDYKIGGNYFLNNV